MVMATRPVGQLAEIEASLGLVITFVGLIAAEAYAGLDRMRPVSSLGRRDSRVVAMMAPSSPDDDRGSG
jgi:hypothetical protein